MRRRRAPLHPSTLLGVTLSLSKGYGAPCLAAFAIVLLAVPAYAQIDGHVSVMYDVLPDVSPVEGMQFVGELRTRLFAEHKRDLGDHVRIVAGGYFDTLAGRRAGVTATDAIVRPADVYAEVAYERFDLRAGFSRVVWGRLDEFLPTDVVNPIDLSRFLLESRAEARLSSAMIRGRLFLPGSSTLEAILVPAFRAGRFDQLDEATSPFNLVASSFPTMRFEPDFGARNMQGGGRFTTTTGRVDWGVSGYTGVRPFPVVTGVPSGASIVLHETFPRFTMIGGDFETVRGAWGVRGEVAVSVDEDAVEGGVGIDRRAGDYRVAGNVMVSRSGDLDQTSVTIVGAAERSFARDTRRVRVFTAWDPEDRTVFGRAIVAFNLRDNLWLETSGGLFAGSSLTTLGRLTHRDFLYAHLKVFF